jgi:hypothetical protein
MEKKDKLFVLLVALGGAYAVHANWDRIRERLGLEDMYPGRIKAMQLAKSSHNFQAYAVNWAVLRDREANGEIKTNGDPWAATEIEKPRYRVTCTYTEQGERRVHRFTVDVGTGSVTYHGLDETKPAPR